MALAKICGLSDRASLDAALIGGARFVGFVFFEKSPRNVDIENAAALAVVARGRAEIVAVTVDAPDALLARIAERVAPDWVQLHGREPPARSLDARRFARRGAIRAASIAAPEDFAAVAAHAETADMILFDAKAPKGADLPGGNGAAFDWTLLAGRPSPKPWFLSGGLEPNNVKQAIAATGAAYVDVSSGVERAPGVKDADRIAAFLAAASAANG